MNNQFQVMPPIAAEEYEALKADIAEHGVLVAVEIDEEGSILDGHHRVRACEELGITDYPRTVRTGLADEQKRQHARRLNLTRRHLSQAQKRELIRQQIEESPEMSDRQIAKLLGVSHPTVGTVRRLITSAQVVNFTTLSEEGTAFLEMLDHEGKWTPAEGQELVTEFFLNGRDSVIAEIFPHAQQPGFYSVVAVHLLPDDQGYVEGTKKPMKPEFIPWILHRLHLPTDRAQWRSIPFTGTSIAPSLKESAYPIYGIPDFSQG